MYGNCENIDKFCVSVPVSVGVIIVVFRGVGSSMSFYIPSLRAWRNFEFFPLLNDPYDCVDTILAQIILFWLFSIERNVRRMTKTDSKLYYHFSYEILKL